MNFLGHAFFSPKDNKIILGNVLGDTYKGRVEKLDVGEKVKEGIILHRRIDSFGDNLEEFSLGKSKLKDFGLYSGVILDIFFDYFLAKYFHEYESLKLEDFEESIYASIENNKNELNEKGESLFYYMSNGKWLSSYKHIYIIEDVLSRVSRRANSKYNLADAVKILNDNYDFYYTIFNRYMKKMVEEFK